MLSRREFREAASRADREVAPRPDDLTIAGARFRVLRSLARGEHADVLLAERARRLTERVVVKMLREPSLVEAADREWAALSSLAAGEAQGAAHFSRRVPAPVLRGNSARSAGGSGRPCIVTGALPGFRSTLAEVRAAFPGGLDARHAVWVWRRLLELLGWVHRCGWAHGAVGPSHVVIDEREHGAILVSWSRARRIEEGGSVAADLTMTARAVDSLLGPADPAPAPLRDLLDACLSGRPGSEDGWALMETVAAAAAQAYGKPTFVPLHLPLPGQR